MGVRVRVRAGVRARVRVRMSRLVPPSWAPALLPTVSSPRPDEAKCFTVSASSGWLPVTISEPEA
jgi:hypothetical protein